jgi:acetylornithine deacetylase/succinyl-diaminopimelate desuccinylase family protein
MTGPDTARLRQRLAGLVAWPTENLPGNEAESARWLGKELAAIGCAVSYQAVAENRENVVGIIDNGPGPCLAFNSHLDVIPAGNGWTGDPWTLRAENGRLIGRGACDAKGSIASMVEAMAMLAAERGRWSGRLVGVFVADEEVGSTGAKTFAADHPGVDRVVVGEPTDLSAVSAHKGVLRPRIRIAGKSAHSGRPDLGDNAIVKAGKLVARLAAEDARLRTKLHPLVGPSSLSVTRIHGGIADNIVPPWCELTIDRRVLPSEQPEAVDLEIRALLAAALAEDGIATEILGYTSTAGPSETPADDPIIRAAVGAARANGVEPPGPIGFLGGCDLVHFQRVGIRGVVLGPGSLGMAHKPDEYVPEDELARAAIIYRDLALAYYAGGGR